MLIITMPSRKAQRTESEASRPSRPQSIVHQIMEVSKDELWKTVIEEAAERCAGPGHAHLHQSYMITNSLIRHPAFLPAVLQLLPVNHLPPTLHSGAHAAQNTSGHGQA